MSTTITANETTVDEALASESSGPTTGALVLAFAAIYLIWGSTYLAIRFAIETIPPLLMLGTRFGIAGLAMTLWARSRGAVPATRQQWRWAWLLGVLMPCWGTGSVAWAEQTISSGLAALLVAILPLLVVVIETFVLRERRLSPGMLVGVVVGFAGIAYLVRPGFAVPDTGAARLGVGVLITGITAWGVGSVYSRRAALPASKILAIGMQMLTGGVSLVAIGLLLGEGARFHPAELSAVSVVAWLYLVVFGTFCAFSAYLWLLQVTAPTRVATYAYVNPLVALFLGWALAGEDLNAQILITATIVLGSVALILKSKSSVK